MLVAMIIVKGIMINIFQSFTATSVSSRLDFMHTAYSGKNGTVQNELIKEVIFRNCASPKYENQTLQHFIFIAVVDLKSIFSLVLF